MDKMKLTKDEKWLVLEWFKYIQYKDPEYMSTNDYALVNKLRKDLGFGNIITPPPGSLKWPWLVWPVKYFIKNPIGIIACAYRRFNFVRWAFKKNQMFIKFCWHIKHE